MSKPNKTDWDRVKAEAAADKPIAYDPETDPYDPNDEKAVEAFFAKAKVVRRRGPQKAPTKVQTAMRLDVDVVEHFKAAGAGWQTRVNDALKKAIDAGIA